MKLNESRIATNLLDAVPADLDVTPPHSPRFLASACLPDGWLVRQVASNRDRIEQCVATEQALRERIMLRAKLTWDGDRRLEATLLGGKRTSKPERVVAQLRESLHGVDWLLSHWTMLVQVGQAQGGWTGDQAQLASELFGTSKAFQHAQRPDSWLAFGDPKDGPSALDLARREVADLKTLREDLIPLDQQARAQAMAGLAADSDPDIKRLRRQEAMLHNRLRWTLDRIEELAIDDETRPEAGPEAEAAKPEKAETPPAPPTRANSRVEARLKQAEDRRQALLRKRERQRA